LQTDPLTQVSNGSDVSQSLVLLAVEGIDGPASTLTNLTNE
jgi:hypothetical protein